ncbi:UNVERIFIED_CONTAM: hypothetical protein HDU68_001669 [Siphonaria sp. JEL0065]|nr:hypothetical protein HDU68_001669 [Siphonaria sp. JEL0065]
MNSTPVTVLLHPSPTATCAGGFVRGFPGLHKADDGKTSQKGSSSTLALQSDGRGVSVVGMVHIVFPVTKKPKLEDLRVTLELPVSILNSRTKTQILVKAETPVNLADMPQTPFIADDNGSKPMVSESLRCVEFPINIPLTADEVSSLPPSVALTPNGPFEHLGTADLASALYLKSPMTKEHVYETGVFYVLRCEARFQGYLENVELADQVLIMFPVFKEPVVVGNVKHELPSRKIIRREGKWSSAPPKVLKWSLELDSHDERSAVGCVGDRRVFRFKVHERETTPESLPSAKTLSNNQSLSSTSTTPSPTTPDIIATSSAILLSQTFYTEPSSIDRIDTAKTFGNTSLDSSNLTSLTEISKIPTASVKEATRPSTSSGGSSTTVGTNSPISRTIFAEPEEEELTATVQRVIFAEPDEEETEETEVAVTRIIYAEPDEEQEGNRWSEGFTKARTRVSFAEPEEKEAEASELLESAPPLAPPAERLIYSEPEEEVESLIVSELEQSASPLAFAVERVIYAEPDEDVEFDHVPPQDTVSAIPRVIYAEPDEEEEYRPVSANVPVSRVIYDEPEETSSPILVHVESSGPIRVIYAEPDEESVLVVPDEPIVARVIYAEPDEEEEEELTPTARISRVLYAEPDEESDIQAPAPTILKQYQPEPAASLPLSTRTTDPAPSTVLPLPAARATPAPTPLLPPKKAKLSFFAKPVIHYVKAVQSNLPTQADTQKPTTLPSQSNIQTNHLPPPPPPPTPLNHKSIASSSSSSSSSSSNSQPIPPLESGPLPTLEQSPTKTSLISAPSPPPRKTFPSPTIPVKSSNERTSTSLPIYLPPNLPPNTIIFPVRHTQSQSQPQSTCQDLDGVVRMGMVNQTDSQDILIQDLRREGENDNVGNSKIGVATPLPKRLEGYASIAVVLVETWSWDTPDYKKSGAREITLFELTETDQILFSKGERVEVTLPETLLPSINIKESPTIKHKIVIHFTWYTSATGPSEKSTQEIPIRIAPFTRRDLDTLLTSPKHLPASIAAILPPGFGERKQREKLRKESVETLRSQQLVQQQLNQLNQKRASFPLGVSTTGIQGENENKKGGKKLQFSIDTGSAGVNGIKDGPRSPPSFGVLRHTGPNEWRGISGDVVTQNLEKLKHMTASSEPLVVRRSAEDGRVKEEALSTSSAAAKGLEKFLAAMSFSNHTKK